MCNQINWIINYVNGLVLTEDSAAFRYSACLVSTVKTIGELCIASHCFIDKFGTYT